MRICEIGVFHQDCWFNKALEEFPEIYIKEISSRATNYSNKKRVNHGVFRITAQHEEEAKKALEFVRNQNGVIEAVPLTMNGSELLLGVSWYGKNTSYDSIINSGCFYSTPTYSKQGLETYSLFSSDPKQIGKLLEEFEQIGQTKIFKIKGEEELKNGFGLTQKQKEAITAAISMGYYEWPKKKTLEELAQTRGQKRRAFQENLRKAESKIFKKIFEQLYE